MTYEPVRGAPGDRVHPRSSMFVAAVLRVGARQAPVKVRNMSLNGAMLDSPLVLAPETRVELIRGSLIAEGEVVWCSEGRCGLHFHSQIAVKDWLAPPTKIQQERVDAIVSLVKAGVMPAALDGDERRTAAPAVSDSQLLGGLSDLMELMQDLEGELASCEDTVARHGAKLQNIDIAIQMVRAILRALNPRSTDAEPNLATLEDLRIVCAQALRSNQ